MKKKKIHVLQLITPVGFYGAERWILALANNSDNESVRHDLAVTMESEDQNLKITELFPEGEGKAFRVKMNGRFDWKAIYTLTDIVKERQIDVIHTHGYKSDILGTIVARKNSIKCISTPHGFGQPEGFKLKLFIRLGIFSFRFMDKVIPLSCQLNQQLINFGIPNRKLKLIQNAVDLTEVDQAFLKKKPQANKLSKKIGYIGRFDENKNIADILKIFHQLWVKNQNIELVLVGDGDTRNELEQFADTLSSRDAIHFAGFRYDRLNWLKEFDIFMMTSRNEGTPRCIMEAMAMEVPVVAYGIPGVMQLVTHNETGFLAEFGDIDSMVGNCSRALRDSALCRKVGKQARQFIDQNYSGRRMAQDYLKTYQDILY